MPLSQAERSHLEVRLLEERERVTSALARIGHRLARGEGEQSGDLSQVPFHPADLGTDEMAREVDEEEETRLSVELTEIHAALERLYRSPARFGTDERTGEDIPLARLEVVPWARRRIDASP